VKGESRMYGVEPHETCCVINERLSPPTEALTVKFPFINFIENKMAKLDFISLAFEAVAPRLNNSTIEMK
jgi:hypothetical protein